MPARLLFHHWHKNFMPGGNDPLAQVKVPALAFNQQRSVQ